MKNAILILAFVPFAGCAGMEALFEVHDAQTITDNRYRGETVRNRQHEARYREAARQHHRRTSQLDRDLRRQQKKIDEEVEAEFALEMAKQSPLGHGDIVALFPVEAPASIDPTTTDTLDALLFLALTKTDRFRFVPRRTVATAVDEIQRGSFKACVDEQCAIEIGRAVAAERVLAPRLYQAGETCILSLTLYDLRTETGEWATTTKVPCHDRALRDGAQTLAARVEPAKAIPRRAFTAEKAKKKKRERPMRPVFTASEGP